MLFNLIFLPVVGIYGTRILPANMTGVPPAPYGATAAAAGEGEYENADEHLKYSGDWREEQISAETIGTKSDRVYLAAGEPGSRHEFTYHGQKIELIHSVGPDHGI